MACHRCGPVIWRGSHALWHVRPPKSIGLSRRVGRLDTRPRIGYGWGTVAVSGRHALDPKTTGAALRIPISRTNDSQYRSTTRDRGHAVWGWLGTIRVLPRTRHCEPTLWLSNDDNFLSSNDHRHVTGSRRPAINNSVKQISACHCGAIITALRQVQRVLLQNVQRDDVECFLMGSAQKQPWCLTGLVSLMPPHCAETPSITGP